jgi:uncharacterized SAM-binding protein YcdF (DUF218 family)
MYFEVSKTLGLFLVPTNLIACLALLGLVLMSLRRPLGKPVALLALAALAIAALSPLGNMLLTPLEQRFPGMRYPDRRIDGIIVLGGSYDTVIHNYLSTIVLEEDTQAMAVIASLGHRYPDARIIFSGGNISATGSPDEAALARSLFVSFGIEAGRISTEDQSRTTEENARFTAALINPAPHSRWLLVTSAYQMPRAVGAFRTAGLDVIAFPVGWRTNGWRNFWWSAPSATENLRRVDVAAHEWVGLATYRLLGYSADWFPGELKPLELAFPR